MKKPFILLLVLLLAGSFMGGCSGQKAEQEYKRILDAELAGGEPKAMISQYQALIDQYPKSDSSTRARERLIALKAKIESEAKVAQLRVEQEAKEQKLRAEQEEKERLQKQKERELLDEELRRQQSLLVDDMKDAAKKAALKLHLDTEVTECTRIGDPKDTGDWEKKAWLSERTYFVRLKGTLLGISTYTEVVDCTGEIQFAEVNKQFKRSVTAKPH